MMPCINIELAQDPPTNPPSPGNPPSRPISPSPSLSYPPTHGISPSQSHPISIPTTLLYPPNAGPCPAKSSHSAPPAQNSKPNLPPKPTPDAPRLGSHYSPINTHTHTSPVLSSNPTLSDPFKIPRLSRPFHNTTDSPATAPITEEFKVESELNREDLPAGFPYTDWRGVWSFAWEYIRGMQDLVMEWTEGTGRYGPVRQTT